MVAPYVGAWIETVEALESISPIASHPTWVRGLKHQFVQHKISAYQVAPYVGAWIETDFYT